MSVKRKLILDVDTGIDDALALAYVSTFDDVELLGSIGTYGNVTAGRAEHAICAGLAGIAACAGSRGLHASIMGRFLHRGRGMRAIPWNGRPGWIRAGSGPVYIRFGGSVHANIA